MRRVKLTQIQGLFDPPKATSVADLVSLALALGAGAVAGWSRAERILTEAFSPPDLNLLADIQSAIQQGHDPIGEAFCQLLSPEQRRPLGAVYTPQVIIDAMLAWVANEACPDRVIDPGTGSARFLVSAGRRFPNAQLYGVEIDPSVAILARGHLAAAGLSARAHIVCGDYREVALEPIEGRTLFIGNPPYVRHHNLGQRWKQWLVDTAHKYHIDASQLAGLHAHFFLATAERARSGDVGVLITAAEWLDVNYGRLIRELLLGTLGVRSIHVIEPTADPFSGTATTAVITGFRVGDKPKTIGLRRVAKLEDLKDLSTDRHVRRERLEAAHRWSPLTRASIDKPEGFIELGELCRVHRGQVTGSNRVWIAGAHSAMLPQSVLYAAVTKARELFGVNGLLADASPLRRVIDIPTDLDQFEAHDRRSIGRFLKYARLLGADRTYVATHRRAWWSVGLRDPAPILATYMARRPPTFVRNVAGVRHINIAHGLYPREPLPETILTALAQYLSRHIAVSEGRTYAGGLTKFEPREMERLLIPHPGLLASGEWGGGHV